MFANRTKWYTPGAHRTPWLQMGRLAEPAALHGQDADGPNQVPSLEIV